MRIKTSSKQNAGNRKVKVLALTFLLPFLLLLTSCKTEDIIVNNNLDVQTELGYHSSVSLWDGNPIKFTITNTGSDFNGEIRIFMPLNFNEKCDIVIPVDVPANSKETIEEYIPIIDVSKEFTYSIVSNDRTIKTDRITIDKFLDPEKNKIAVVADKSDDYNFLTVAPLSKNYERVHRSRSGNVETAAVEKGVNESVDNFLVAFDSLENFHNKNALEFFDYIFIGDISNLKLSEQGERNLTTWLNSGGVLIVESGNNFEKMKSILPSSLKVVDYDAIQKQTIDNKKLQTTIDIASAKIQKKGVKEVRLYDTVLAYKKDIGSGYIISINTDLTAKQLQKKNAAVLSNILNQAGVVSSIEKDNDNRYYIHNSLDYIPDMKELPYAMIAIILLAYVIIAAPILYFILKKLDKQNLMWILAPAISIVVIVMISQIGSYVWGNKPIVNEASLIHYNQENNSLQADSNIALFNNKKSDMKITWDKNDDVEVELSDWYNYFSDEKDNDYRNRTLVSSIFLTNDPLFYSYNTSLWGNIKAKGRKNISLEDKGTAISFTNRGEDKIVKLKNGLPLDFKQTILYWNSQYYLLGAIESNEEKEINLSTVKSDLDVFGFELPDEQGDDYHYAYNSMERIVEDKSSFKEAYVFGFNYKAMGYQFKINDEKPKVYARNLIVMKLDMGLEKGATVELRNRDIKTMVNACYANRENPNSEEYENNELQILDVDYDYEYPSIRIHADDSINTILTSFEIPQDITVESISIDFNTGTEDALGENNLNANMVEDKHYIYNVKTESYDEISFENEGMINYLSDKVKTIDINKYVNENGIIKTKVIKAEELDNKYYEMKTQSIVVKGVYND